ncbi:MAG: SURF1 family protein [Acidimicrobiia bacterium]|nr:MAG: SURF1 family protein [Acidimicrobiia bacterium]
MKRYAFLRSPVWIAGIIIALVTVVVFVNLGRWQLRRLDERQAINATIEARSTAEPVQLEEAIATYGADSEALAYRRVLVAGDYDLPEEVLVLVTTLNGRSGHDVLTPIRGAGFTLAVDRGWVPIDTEGPPVVGAAPPTGPVVVVGMLLEGQTFRALGIPEADGSYQRIGRIDLDVLAGQWGSDLLPVYLLLEKQAPAGGDLPLLRPPPEPSEGPHLGYAVQWFIFAVIVAVGFPALVYRTGR